MSRRPRATQVTRDPDAPRRVGLDPQAMVDWLSPTELLRAAVKAILAATFGNYADKREVQAALSPGPGSISRDYSDVEDVWFDYAADIGDGFNPTYAVAWLLAQESLVVLPAPAEAEARDTEKRTASTLPAGRFVILGGDQVYPTPRRGEYKKRFLDPYQKAFDLRRHTAASETDLFVIPGNHDWYDGLTSFVRLFCQGRILGRLRTFQQRSYFALRLPHDWWLWGIDIQLEEDIDEPQKLFFRDVADAMKKVSGDRKPHLILCTGQPSWVRCGVDTRRDTLGARTEAFETLSYFEELIASCGIHLRVTIAGDLHHFAHYAPDAPGQPHRITAGGGGAYLYPTHHLPDRLALTGVRNDLWRPAAEAERVVTYRLACVYPTPDDSRTRSWRVLALPFRNLSFASFIGGFYVVFSWILQSASKSPDRAFDFLARAATPAPREPATSLMDVLKDMNFLDFLDASTAFWHVMRHSPSSVLLAGVVIVGLWKYRASENPRNQLWGAVHGALHVLVCMLLIWLFSVINLRVAGLNVDHPLQVGLFTAEMLLIGGAAGAFLFAVYLLSSARRSGVHVNEVYSSQGVEDRKSFLRLHIDGDGTLEIHPVAIPTVPRDDGWRVLNSTDLAPAAGTIPVHLASDAPIRIERVQPQVGGET